MSLSKKHYEAIARIMAQDYPLPENNTPDSVWRRSVEHLSQYFAADNPRFDRERFLKACGLEYGDQSEPGHPDNPRSTY